MSTHWDNIATEYGELISNPSNHSAASIRALIGSAASKLPRDNPESLSWFIAGLQNTPRKWFVAEVMASATPVPSTMLDPLLIAALLEPNPSATRVFVEPCVKGFGASEVEARLAQLASAPGVSENGGVQKVMYWVPRVGA